MKIREIPLKEILPDFFFCFSNVSDRPSLCASIQTIGIRSPLWVLPARSGFRILSGFRRFQCAFSMDLSPLPCLVLSESVPLEEHFFHVLLEQTTIRPLHLLEKAKAIRILRRIGLDSERIATQFSSILEFPPKSAIIDSVYGLLTFHPQFQSYLAKYPIALKQLSPFHRFSVNEQAHLAHIGEALAIRTVELSEIASTVWEIGRKENIPPQEIMKECIEPYITREEWSREEKIQKIKTELQNRRFPKRTFWNLQLKKFQQELKFPSSLTLRWDPLLEEPGFQIHIKVSQKKHIDEVSEFFASELHREKLKSMLEWL